MISRFVLPAVFYQKIVSVVFDSIFGKHRRPGPHVKMHIVDKGAIHIENEAKFRKVDCHMFAQSLSGLSFSVPVSLPDQKLSDFRPRREWQTL